MGYSLQDALRILAEIEGLESTISAKRHTLKKALASLAEQLNEAPALDEVRCGHCGLTFVHSDLGRRKRQEHIRNVHGYESALLRERLLEELATVEKAE